MNTTEHVESTNKLANHTSSYSIVLDTEQKTTDLSKPFQYGGKMNATIKVIFILFGDFFSFHCKETLLAFLQLTCLVNASQTTCTMHTKI